MGKVSGSVWFLCNGLDSDKTVLLERDFNPTWNSTGIVSFSVCKDRWFYFSVSVLNEIVS